MFGRKADDSEVAADMELVRLAIPRRTYSKSHLEYMIEVFKHIKQKAPTLRGFKIVEEPPQLRHFTARFEKI